MMFFFIKKNKIGYFTVAARLQFLFTRQSPYFIFLIKRFRNVGYTTLFIATLPQLLCVANTCHKIIYKK